MLKFVAVGLGIPVHENQFHAPHKMLKFLDMAGKRQVHQLVVGCDVDRW